jgi:hypothetical protein
VGDQPGGQAERIEVACRRLAGFRQNESEE